MSNMYSEFANAVTLYQSTIANANASTGSYYNLNVEFGIPGLEAVTSPESLTLLDDGIKFTKDDGGGGTVTGWAPLTSAFSFTLELITSS